MYVRGFYFDWLAAAFVRGVRTDPDLAYPPTETLHLEKALDQLSDQELEDIVQSGSDLGFRLYRFKRTANLPRVARVLTILHGIEPTNLLDVGTGRGAFLWPLLDAFPALPVMAVDKEEDRVKVLRAVNRGGVPRLSSSVEDATRLSFADASFDVVTMLEVVEHVAEAMKALAEAVRVARRFVVISVPLWDDDSLHHVHLFTPERLAEMLQLAGASRVTTDVVNHHLIAIGRISRV